MAEVKPYYEDHHIKIFNKDCRSMDEIPSSSVQCVVTSPPYWGLRKYSGEQELIWGEPSSDEPCRHQWNEQEQVVYGDAKVRWQHAENVPDAYQQWDTMKKSGKTQAGFCSLCGAWKGSYGLEPTPEMYIQHTIEILREIRRVLRKDGVVFWNIGDSYTGSGVHSGGSEKQRSNNGAVNTYIPPKSGSYLKPKDLCLIPFRVAIAAQEDGWWVRSVIIWSKPNPMPESVTDRPTESHEYILMLTKSKTYYWDADAVREPMNFAEMAYRQKIRQKSKYNYKDDTDWRIYGDEEIKYINSLGRNIRSVWEFPTQPYPLAHFAVFPEKLPEICIKAATPEVGCCSKCRAPWMRVTKDIRHYKNIGRNASVEGSLETGRRYQDWYQVESETLCWQPTCKCNADKVPSLVLDLFAGAGTTLWVAKRLNRKAIGYEISREYCKLALNRNRQQVFI